MSIIKIIARTFPALFMIHECPNWLWNYVKSQAFREWSTVAAELLVAWVIYRELQQNRMAAFLEKATNPKTNKERREIYNAYFSLAKTHTNLDEVSKAFHAHVPSVDGLRATCEKQIALFNELGIVCKKPFWFMRNRMVTVLPHAAIYTWIFCREYIIQRRRDAGSWFAKPLLEFTLESVKYVLKFKHGLCLRSGLVGTSEKKLEISVADLLFLRTELKRELRA